MFLKIFTRGFSDREKRVGRVAVRLYRERLTRFFSPSPPGTMPTPQKVISTRPAPGLSPPSLLIGSADEAFPLSLGPKSPLRFQLTRNSALICKYSIGRSQWGPLEDTHLKHMTNNPKSKRSSRQTAWKTEGRGSQCSPSTWCHREHR